MVEQSFQGCIFPVEAQENIWLIDWLGVGGGGVHEMFPLRPVDSGVKCVELGPHSTAARRVLVRENTKPPGPAPKE